MRSWVSVQGTLLFVEESKTLWKMALICWFHVSCQVSSLSLVTLSLSLLNRRNPFRLPIMLELKHKG